MLTRNFSMACNTQGWYSFDGAIASGGYAQVITANPVTANAYYTNGTSGYYVDVGFDDTAPTVNDYKLGDSNILDTNKLTWVSSTSVNTEPYIRMVSSTYRNDGSDAVVVKEIGIVSKTNTANTNARNGLLTHSVLSTPVTIAPGETFTFTVSLEL